MLKIKAHEEFAKWWKHWIAKIDLGRVMVKHSSSEKKINADVERSVDGEANRSEKVA